MAAVAVISTMATADAHALLIRSDPPQGARLQEPPARVTAWFSEPLERGISSLRVLDGSSGRVEDGPTVFDPSDSTSMSVAVRSDLPPGFYLVTWETLSRIDGHIRFGSFDFTVLNPDGSEPRGPRPGAALDITGTPTGVAEGAVTKTVGLIGAVILVGGLAAVVFVVLPSAGSLSREPTQRLREGARRFLVWVALPAAILLLLTAGGELWLQARQFGGLDQVGQVLGTEWGERWVWRQLVLGVLIAGLLTHVVLRPRTPTTHSLPLWSALAAGFFYLLLVSLVSHAKAVALGSFWTTAADFVHLATASIWIGGLVVLAALLFWSRGAVDRNERPALLAAAIQRFSHLAATTIVLLLATGIFNALVQVSTWSALVETAYGRALTIKLVLMVPLLAMAGLNAFILRPRLIERASSDSHSVERLRRLLVRAVPLEAALGVAVLAIVGVLVQYTPARVEAEAATHQQAAALAGVEDRGAFDFPLVTGDWSWVMAAGLAAAGVVLGVWTAHVRPRQLLGGAARAGAFALPAVAALIAVIDLATPSEAPAFEAAVAFRYEATDGRQVLLEIDPLQVGPNTFKVTLLTEKGKALEADSVALRLSRLEVEGSPVEVVMIPRRGGDPSYFGDFQLTETGWWEIQTVLDLNETVSFYLRLDNPSKAPLEFAAPDYQSDPAAEGLYQEALKRHQSLAALKWREELTSGLLAPTGIGAWVLTDGEAEAPDRVHLRVLSPGSSNYEVYRVGDKGCAKDVGGAYQCSTGEGFDPFGLDYLEPPAFRLGRREVVDGEMTQVLLVYNPGQPAWYAWWVGEQTGYLRRQAMVAPGHFMLTRFFDHNVPIGIEIPQEALASGG